jgi:hypothetical protein
VAGNVGQQSREQRKKGYQTQADQHQQYQKRNAIHQSLKLRADLLQGGRGQK